MNRSASFAEAQLRERTLLRPIPPETLETSQCSFGIEVVSYHGNKVTIADGFPSPVELNLNILILVFASVYLLFYFSVPF
jgi:hypothetical protein